MFVVRARSCVATVAKSICHVVRMIGKPAGLLVHAIDLITANCSLKPNVSRSHLLYRIVPLLAAIQALCAISAPCLRVSHSSVGRTVPLNHRLRVCPNREVALTSRIQPSESSHHRSAPSPSPVVAAGSHSAWGYRHSTGSSPLQTRRFSSLLNTTGSRYV